MAVSKVVVCALVALAMAVAADGTVDVVLNATEGIVNGVLNKNTPTPAPADVNEICSNVVDPPGFPRVPSPQFSISSNVFNGAAISFSPKPTYVQLTLDFNQVLPLYNQDIFKFEQSCVAPLTLT